MLEYPLDLFCLAEEYVRGGSILLESLNPPQAAQTAHMTPLPQLKGDLVPHLLHSLGLEAYLKCLQKMRGVQKSGYDLRSLYNGLPDTDRDLIREQFNSRSDKRVELGWALDVATEYFVLARYDVGIAKPKLTHSSDDEATYLGVIPLTLAVRGAILLENPHWKKMYAERSTLQFR